MHIDLERKVSLKKKTTFHLDSNEEQVEDLSLPLSSTQIQKSNSHVFSAEDKHVERQQLETTAVLWSVLRKRHYGEQLVLTLLCQTFIFEQPQSACARSTKQKQQKKVNNAGLAWVPARL